MPPGCALGARPDNVSMNADAYRRMSAMDMAAVEVPTIRRSQTMQAITTVGLDIAKSIV